MKPAHAALIGCNYGVYRVIGEGAQATINIIAWHVGFEPAKLYKRLWKPPTA